MAAHTVAAVILLTVGVVALYPDQGLLGLMRAGGGGAIVARTVIPLACMPLAIALALYALERHGIIGERLTMSLLTLSMVGLVAAMMIVLAARLRRADADARAGSDRLQAIFENVPAALSLRGLDGRYLNVNERAAAILGRPAAELVGTRPEEISLASAVAADDLAMSRSGLSMTSEQRVGDGSGRPRDYQVVRYPVLGRGGETMAFGTFAVDITEQKQTIAALELARERFSLDLRGGADRDGRARPGRAHRTGQRRALPDPRLHPRAPGERQQRRPGERRGPRGQPLHPPGAAGRDHALGQRRGALSPRGRTRRRRRRAHRAAARSGRGPAALLLQVQDITERKRDHEHLAHLADHDPLTGVQNRRAFQRTLAQHTSRDRRAAAAGSLMVIDLDGFKQINDTLGHQAGDELIAHLAHQLTGRLHARDVVARLGGDEFAVLLPESDLTEAVRVGEQLLDVVRTESPAGGRPVSASIGVASLIDQDEVSAREILRNADRAMYEAKASGGDRVGTWRSGTAHRGPAETERQTA